MRSTNRIYSALILTVLFASLALQASAETVFYDDFSDGSVTNDVPVDRNGNPVKWTELSNGDFDATSGDYVFTPTSNSFRMFSSVVDITLTDFSIRTQVRSSSAGGAAVVTARLQDPLALLETGGYFGAIQYDSDIGGTILRLGRTDGPGVLTFFGDNQVLPFDVRTEDAVLQLDIIDNRLKLWAWKAGGPVPNQPQLTATDNTYSEGAMWIFSNPANSNIATFRYVHVADMHIPIPVPEPTTFLLAMLGMAAPCCYRLRR